MLARRRQSSLAKLHVPEPRPAGSGPAGLVPRSRVLIVSQATSDGVAVCLRDLIEAAIGGGYLVTVACPAAGDLARWATERGAYWERLDMRRAPHPSDLVALARLRSLARGHCLVHLHSAKAGAVGRLALASLGRGRPASVFTPHAWSWLAGRRLAPLYRMLERTMLPLTDAVVAVSEEERASGQAALGVAAARIVVNPNGVDVLRFRPDGPVAPRSGDPLIVSVGRLAPQRGPDIAVAALALMCTPRARLRLVGDGPERARIERRAAALGLAGRVELAGYRPDPAPDIRAADVVIVPSRYDGMALVVLEAMACGAAIVATRVSGAACLDGAGILVQPEDPQALADAIDLLMSDPGLRRQLGDAARARVVDRYRLQCSLDGTLSLWRELGAVPAIDHRRVPVPGMSAERPGYVG